MKIREVIKLIEKDGWYQVTCKGSHRQYKHIKKTGRVTIAGNLGHDLAPGTLNSILKQARINKKANTVMYRYLIVIEKAKSNYSAYCPDLPGCVATGKTVEETEKNIHEAIQCHIDGLIQDKKPIPKAKAIAEFIAVG